MAILALTKMIRLGRRYSRVHGWYHTVDDITYAPGVTPAEPGPISPELEESLRHPLVELNDDGSPHCAIITPDQFWHACERYVERIGLWDEQGSQDVRGPGFWFAAVARELGLISAPEPDDADLSQQDDIRF